jgi:hypothetical protein
MQTIITKYYGATNHKPARVAAWNSMKTEKVWLEFDYSLGDTDNHIKVARLLKYKIGWNGDWYGGRTNDGMVFVMKCLEYGL